MTKLPEVNLELLVPGRRTATATLDLRDLGKKLFPTTLSALIAGAALAFNVWLAGIFNSGHPLNAYSWKFAAVIFLQAVVVSYAIIISSALAVDVAGGILAGTIIIIVGDVFGAFRGAFDVEQFVAQLAIAYFVIAVLALATAFFKRNTPDAPPPVPEPLQ